MQVRCRLHKGRNIAWDNLKQLPPEQCRQLAAQIYPRLHDAWDEPDRAEAQGKIHSLADWLRVNGFDEAADCSLRDMDETLALQALGVTDPDVVKTVCSSNAQEAVHDTIGDWEEHIGRWFEPSDTGASELPAVP